MLVAACSSAAATPSPTATPVPATPTPVATAATTPTPAPTVNPCDKAQLKTLTAGKLTIGTDNPAYPPYFAAPADGKYHAPWKDQGDPYTGEGFESAVAYAVTQKLGFAQADVAWTVVPFDSSYAPGAKTFDFYVAQVSYTTERAQAVDMTDGYYFVNQSVVALKSNAISSAKTISDLKKYKFGAQVGTTAYTTIQNTIAPTAKPSVYDTNDAAIAALKAKQIDGLVVDLPTADFITSVQLDGSVIVGQFSAAQGANAEHFSLVLAKGSSLTTCVNQAIAALKSDGTLDSLTKKWLAFVSVPTFGQ
jgi:polar amino acid transport system substrate-binding protein